MLSKIYYLVAFCFMLAFCFEDLKNIRASFKRPKLVSNLPTKYDLDDYLGSLNRVISFSAKHEKELDINVYFGLFLVNVNLKRALQETHQAVPQKLETYVKEIVANTENVLDIFKQKLENNYNLRNNKYKAIFSLFAHASSWIERLPNILGIRLNGTVQFLDKVNWNWIMYRNNVDDKNTWVPNPHQSDLCLLALSSASNTIQIGMKRKCRVPEFCYEMVLNGTDFGYALAHRLLFLQQARYGRGCNVFSEKKDREMRQRFCSAAFMEVQYIARHGFQIVDLLLEHVCLCALDGYPQFLKRSWLTKILSFQTLQGCFSTSPQSTCKIMQPGFDSDGDCNGHTTAVAAGTLAMASRFILQSYY